MHDAPSAGICFGMAWRRQPSTTSGSNWPMMWRCATGTGRAALTMQPSGARTSNGASEPALLGTSGAKMQRRPKTL